MFEAEAIWLGDLLKTQAGDKLSPLLNIGSSTARFREIEQPWTEQFIFGPLKQRGVCVLHLDSRSGDGIDIRADVLAAGELPRIRSFGPKAVLCCNILEHVPDPAALARRCVEIVGPGGLIFVTVPYSYPHHRDPIDTMFRPTPEELARLFSPAVIVKGRLSNRQSWWNDVGKRPWILLRPVLRLPFPFVNFAGWKRSVRRLYWLRHRYRVTAALFRVDPSGTPVIDTRNRAP